MPTITRAGRFRAEPVQYGIEAASKSASRGFWIKFSLIEEWDNDAKAWKTLTGLDEAEGCVWFIGKQGNKLQRGIDTLIYSLGWDQNIKSLNGDTDWKPCKCQVIVEPDEYNGVTRYKAQWINPYEGDSSGPRTRGKAPEDELNRLAELLNGEVPF